MPDTLLALNKQKLSCEDTCTYMCLCQINVLGQKGGQSMEEMKRAANRSQALVGFDKLCNSTENPGIRNKETKF